MANNNVPPPTNIPIPSIPQEISSTNLTLSPHKIVLMILIREYVQVDQQQKSRELGLMLVSQIKVNI